MKMKKNISKIASAALVLGLAGSCAAAAYAEPSNEAAAYAKSAEENGNKDGSEDRADSVTGTGKDKEETVYVIAGADGSAERIIVSDVLRNPSGKDKINDVTGLTDIENVKSDAAFKLDGESCVWDAAGEDIYYRGNSTQKLPVNMEISYKLDGKELEPKELAGASGEVEITVKYVNDCKTTVKTDAGEREIYVPFAVMGGTVLDNDKFRNITVSGGRIIDDGDRSIVVGIAFPGLAENLGLDGEKSAMIPEAFTVTAQVTDFQLETVVGVASNEIFKGLGIDLEDYEDGGELAGRLELLDSSMKSIADGSEELYGYMTQLLGGTKELSDGINELDGYAKQLSAGADKLYGEGVVYIDGKLSELSGGLGTVSQNSAALNAGGKQVFEALLQSVQVQLKASGLEQLGLKIPSLTEENYASELDALTAALNKAAAVYPSAGAAAAQTAAAKASLDSYAQFYAGLTQYTAGVDAAAAGSAQLAEGYSENITANVSALSQKLGEFAEGVSSAAEGAKTLYSSAEQIAEGSKKLSEGAAEFYESGIKAALDVLDTLEPRAEILSAMADAAEAYQSYSGIANGMSGSVKFIFRTEPVSK
ncbi:MAG: hypothetical protein NC223_07905 [Butyrivibrio sp.]|nr:hypothetical protein [Butyrivibrio sp.]